jgi:thiol-disulfide isomerase/thioredoxin
VEVLGPESFDGAKLRRSGTWVVDFSAEWCPFCRDFLTVFSTFRGEGDFQLAIGDLTDVHTPLWDEFHLAVTPTIIAFEEGEAFFRRDGRRGEGLDAADLHALRAALENRARTSGSKPNTPP